MEKWTKRLKKRLKCFFKSFFQSFFQSLYMDVAIRSVHVKKKTNLSLLNFFSWFFFFFKFGFFFLKKNQISKFGFFLFQKKKQIFSDRYSVESSECIFLHDQFFVFPLILLSSCRLCRKSRGASVPAVMLF